MNELPVRCPRIAASSALTRSTPGVDEVTKVEPGVAPPASLLPQREFTHSCLLPQAGKPQYVVYEAVEDLQPVVPLTATVFLPRAPRGPLPPQPGVA